MEMAQILQYEKLLFEKSTLFCCLEGETVYILFH